MTIIDANLLLFAYNADAPTAGGFCKVASGTAQRVAE